MKMHDVLKIFCALIPLKINVPNSWDCHDRISAICPCWFLWHPLIKQREPVEGTGVLFHQGTIHFPQAPYKNVTSFQTRLINLLSWERDSQDLCYFSMLTVSDTTSPQQLPASIKIFPCLHNPLSTSLSSF